MNLIKNIPQVFFVLLFIGNTSTAAPNSDLTREAGDVRGVVSFCGDPMQDVLVYAAGTSFSARTDALGRFKISYFQQGTYDLVVKKGVDTLGTIPLTLVVKKQTTDVGIRNFCNDLDGDGYSPPEDCDDSNPNVNQDMAEACGDGIDNNCNGTADEGCTTCTDNDGDSFFAQSGCGTLIDCNDGNPGTNPLALEVCDTVDNNCDGAVDEAGAVGELTWYVDSDNDGFGDPNTALVSCIQPDESYVLTGDDCDDSSFAVNPAAVEVCGDGVDSNCNGELDGGQTWYADFDADTYGDPETTLQSCSPPPGYVADASDCDDTSPILNPNTTWYEDLDGDAYGDPNSTVQSCMPPADHVLTGDDCDDNANTVNPGAQEVCDAVDNDCDGLIDDDDTSVQPAEGCGF